MSDLIPVDDIPVMEPPQPEMTVEEQVKALLAEYADLSFESDAITQRAAAEISAYIPEHIAVVISDVEKNRDDHLALLSEKQLEIKKKIEKLVVYHGASVKGNTAMAVYNKGRESWDSKGLEGYALVHPEIMALKKIGEPTVSIRFNK